MEKNKTFEKEETLVVRNPLYVSGNAETGRVFLTSGFQPPYEGSLAKQLIVSAEGQAYATGGSIQHIFLNDKLSLNEKKLFIKKVLSLPINYFTITPTVSVCNECGEKIVGEAKVCPKCGSKDILVYSRIIGYLRPVARGGKKGIVIDKEKGIYDGEENYWRDERRADFVTREKITRKDLDELMGMLNVDG